MAGVLDGKVNYYKLLFSKILFESDISPLDAVNASGFVRSVSDGSVSGEITLVKADPEAAQVNPFAINNIKAEAINLKLPNMSRGQLINGQYYPIGSAFCVDWRGIAGLEDQLKQAKINTQMNVDLLKNLSAWDALVFASVWAKAEDMILKKIQDDAIDAGIDVYDEDYIIWLRSIKSELYLSVFNNYILPKARAIESGEVAKAEAENAFSKAANVFSACEAQLSAGHIPEALKPKVYQLVDETAKGLSGDYDGNRYLGIVSSLPQESSVFRVIIGAALIFAGLIMAAAMITLAIHTFGIAAPLSAVGLAVSVDLMVAGLATVAAVASLPLVVSAGFFAASKVPTEYAVKNPGGVKNLTSAAEAFHAEQLLKMG